jgi:hypothetical protein
LRELPVTEGNIINDNNFLQCSIAHQDNVFNMLRDQRNIKFSGGLQCNLLDKHFVDNVAKLRIAEIWLACDTDAELPSLITATAMLRDAGFTRRHIRCYVLVGDDMAANERRLRKIYNAGAMPFAQLFRAPDRHKTEYNTDWRKFSAMWSRPAATIAHMERGTDYRDYNT